MGQLHNQLLYAFPDMNKAFLEILLLACLTLTYCIRGYHLMSCLWYSADGGGTVCTVGQY